MQLDARAHFSNHPAKRVGEAYRLREEFAWRKHLINFGNSSLCPPLRLRLFLAAALIAPAVGMVAWMVFSVNYSHDWDNPTDAPGFAFMGMTMLVVVSVTAVWLAIRAFWTCDWEIHAYITFGCGLVVGLASIGLGEAALVGAGLLTGSLRPAFVPVCFGVWLYFALVGMCHWYEAGRLYATQEKIESKV